VTRALIIDIRRDYASRKAEHYDDMTPEQKQHHVEQRAAYDARRRLTNNLFGFWRYCDEGRCKRGRSCRGDQHVCLMRQKHRITVDEKAYLQFYGAAMEADLSHEEAMRIADRRFVAWKARMAQIEQSARNRAVAAAAPGKTPAASPERQDQILPLTSEAGHQPR
jgi:hypothetical protein